MKTRLRSLLVTLSLTALAGVGLAACCATAPAPTQAQPLPEPTPEPTPDPKPEPTPDPTPRELPPVEAVMCGGLGGGACPAGQFCDQPGHCGAGDQTGTCAARPEVCTRDYRPVCGCDGKTYGNSCSAHAAGVSVKADGPCATTP